MILLYFVLFLLALYMIPMSSKSKKPSAAPSAAPGGDYTVYGTMGCGWTRKQLDDMKEKNISHNFVDCSKEKCPEVDGYPAIKHPDGKMTTGYLIL